MNPFEWSTTKILIILLAILYIITFLDGSFSEDCTDVSWTEYGEKKHGVICDEDAKAKLATEKLLNG